MHLSFEKKNLTHHEKKLSLFCDEILAINLNT